MNKQGGTGSRSLCWEAMAIWSHVMELHACISAIHTSGALNREANILNWKVHCMHKWALKDTYLEPVFTYWGFPDVNLFAMKENAKAPRFWSRAGQDWNLIGDTFQERNVCCTFLSGRMLWHLNFKCNLFLKEGSSTFNVWHNLVEQIEVAENWIDVHLFLRLLGKGSFWWIVPENSLFPCLSHSFTWPIGYTWFEHEIQPWDFV